VDLAKQWFLELAKAVACLHDNGIVHRDLKPANVFLENGMVKVGDYGLSKFISSSQRSAQTQSVGTVHYMAPEVSTGNYGKQIDVYAAGVILYEMLTGNVPFDGESAGEILMKHLTANPDLTKLPAGWAEVVGQALAKDPAHRFAAMAEFARAVERVGGGIPTVAPAPVAVKPLPPPVPGVPPVVVAAAPTLRERTAELSLSMAGSTALAVLFSIITLALLANYSTDWAYEWSEFGTTAFLLVLGSWAVLVPAKWWGERKGDEWLRRGVLMTLGLGVGAAATWLNGWYATIPDPFTGTPPGPVNLVKDSVPLAPLFGHMSYFALAFFLLRWWKLTERNRRRRFSFFPVLVTGCVGLVLFFLWPGHETHGEVFLMQGPVVLTLLAAIVQIVSPWDEPAPKPARKLRLRYA
jgi:hypothetical protein